MSLSFLNSVTEKGVHSTHWLAVKRTQLRRQRLCPDICQMSDAVSTVAAAVAAAAAAAALVGHTLGFNVPTYTREQIQCRYVVAVVVE